MNCIGNYFNSKNYCYINEVNQLKEKQLNFVQCFFRRVFGWYAETHLLNVVEKVYPLTLDAHAQGLDSQKVFNLINKANKVYGKAQAETYIKLPSITYQGPSIQGSLSNIQNTVDVGMRYQVNSHIGISSVEFKLTFNPNTQSAESYKVSLFKNNAQKLVVNLPLNLIGQVNNKPLVQQQLKNKKMAIINAFVAKLLASSNRTDEVRYYAHNYLKERLSECDKAQKEGMKTLGWSYEGNEKQEEVIARHFTPSKNIFSLKKEQVTNIANNLEWSQESLSLAFAAEHLRSSSVEYTS